MRKLVICIVAAVCLVNVNCNIYYERYQRSVEDEETGLVESDKATSHDLHKRGIGGLIAVATISTLTLASTGVQLWTALEGGCNIKKSICTDTDEIKRLEGVLTELSQQYDDLYFANKWKYLNLQEAMINNQYILHYINDTVRKVEDIGTAIDIITTRIEVDLATMTQMYASSNDTETIEALVGPFEYQLENIEKLISSMKNQQIISVVVQRSLELFLSKSIKYVNKVIANAKESNVNINDDVVTRVSSDNANLPAQKQKFWNRMKNYFSNKGKSLGFAFKAVGKDIKKQFGTNLPNNVKKWFNSAKKWSTFKKQFKTSFLSETSTVGKIKYFFKNPKSSVKYAVKNFKFSKGQIFLQGIGLVVEGIQQYMMVENWKKVAEEIAEARKSYEQYHDNVVEALEEVRNETKKLDEYWSETVANYKELVLNFMNITDTARENDVFSDVSGLTGLPVDTSDPFFHIDFSTVNKNILKDKQQIAISFFKANGESLSALADKFKVQEILVLETKELSRQNEPISSIFEDLKRIYSNSDSKVIKDYSSLLIEKDVVCSASFVNPNKVVYDFYQIDEFRDTKCAISDGEFFNMQQEAADKRDKHILHKIIVEQVPDKATPLHILDLAKAGYSAVKDPRLQNFGLNLEEKDVVCEISILYPDLQDYSLYDLTQFRPDCSSVTDAEFQQLQTDVHLMQEAKATIDQSMAFCDLNVSFCMCPSTLLQAVKLNHPEAILQHVNTLIEKYKKEKKPNCSYIEENGSCKWAC